MGDIYKDIYSAGQNCINTQFCADGGSFQSSNISLPRSLKIRVIANPAFWGFGTTGENTLIEGWGTFNNARFDFFDGFEPDHAKLKDCDGTVTGPYINEQRPDVAYRSVYDPENGDKHYANGVEDGIVRGGAESYLLDRGGNTTDNRSCDTNDPDGVFKTNPAGYGIAPKILFNSAIYKNITGAWRINECSGCYTQHDGGNDLRNLDCSGAPKQHIQGDEHFNELYDPFRNRCVADGFTSENECTSDGIIAGQYAGTISSIIRDTGVSPFLKYTFQYNGQAASGIFNGKSIGITATSGDGGAITFFEVEHGASSTTAYAVGSFGTGDYSNLDGGSWTLFDSYDPNTCCGGAAYGVDPALMNLTNSPLYHIDIGRVFNSPKNKIYSNRIDRTYNGLTVEPEVPKGTFGVDCKYVAVNEEGNALLVESGALYEVDLNCQTGVWSATGDYIYKLDGQYSTESGIGAEALSTDSGFYPLLPKTLPYYGPFDVVDRFDYTERSNEYGNRQTNRNATCYTKQGSLSVYPDCLSQYTQYTSCDPKTKYTINNVPRIALVYRGCDFDDICTFDDSGRPFTNSSEAGRNWLDDGVAAETFPTNMDQLRRGFGGQEIQMFINLGTARAAEIKRDPCCCKIPCPGTREPVFVEVESPVSYPCFPKFDLRPNEYGALDPRYYFSIMQKIGLDTDPSGGCFIPEYPIDIIQPYTTYGYIRNLCGKETNSRRGVIDSLSEKLHTGDYTDLNPADYTVEPLYVEFDQDMPDCCSPTGFPTGGGGCSEGDGSDLSFDFNYGEGASGEVDVIGGVPSINITAAGSGYVNGASGTVFHNSNLEITFTHGAANNGLDGATFNPSTGLSHDVLGDAVTITTPSQTVEGSGGFAYDDCESQDKVHYWGLTDFQGRLAYPYFRTQPGSTEICGKPAGDFVDYSASGTITKGWPRDKVPFLVEIDHKEYCSSCSTTQMSTGNLSLTVTSLSGEYLHGMNSKSYNSTRHQLYGWTHNAFPGIAHTPIYDASDDAWEPDICRSGDGLASVYGQPYTGHTCECADGASVTMVARTLKGTNVPVSYITSGSVDDNGDINSYVPFGNCSGTDWERESLIATDGPDLLMSEHQIYMSANLSCGDSEAYSSAYDYASVIGAEGLDNIFGCGTECATSFPAPNSQPSLNLDFFYVRREYEDIFAKLPDSFIHKNNDFLSEGLTFSAGAGSWGGQPATITCGSEVGVFDTYTTDSSKCDDFESTAPSGLDDYLALTHCINGNKGKYEASVNLDTCLGSRVVLYACSAMKTGVYNSYSNDSAGKWTIYRGTEGEIDDRKIGGCIRDGAVATGEAYLISDKCFADNSGDYKTVWQNALGLVVNNGDVSALANAVSSCVTRNVDQCCHNIVGAEPIPVGPFAEGNLIDSARNLGCQCRGVEDMDIVYDVTYSELTNPVNGVKTQGWYGDVKFPITNTHAPPLLLWSGENIQGVGNIGPLVMNDPIALHYNDTFINQFAAPGNSYDGINIEKFCAYHTGPNKYSQVGAEVFTPKRNTDLEFGGENLTPDLCTGISTSNEFYGNCGTPVPFDTYAGGITPQIKVVRKSVWPEIMTVHKIECESNGYKLHVSREYFEHNRTWYHLAPCGLGVCPVPKLGLIDGGEVAYQYAPVGDACSEIYYPDCADPNGGAGADQKALPFVLPMMTPTDAVGPIYPDESSPCATGTEIFYKTDTDFVINKTTSDEHPSGCMYFPTISGEQFWNFYNLLYDSGVPGPGYLTDAGAIVYQGVPDPEADCNPAYPFDLIEVDISTPTRIKFSAIDPVFSSISEMRNNPHSCVQDLPECGGMFWNNKEFFPRKSYAVNTRIAPFGALSICEQNAQLEAPSWYDGHTGDTWDQSPNKTELAGGRFVDACDSSAIVLARTAIDIDDNVIYIPGETEEGGEFGSSILALQGKIHPGFTSNLNQKTCVYADSGECLDFWPEHNDSTIRDITFSPDEYGYYLDDLVASGSHDCLFTPFKIMVDVECCPDRVGHKGTGPVGEPPSTNLNYLAKIPAHVCEGWVDQVACNCSPSTCDNRKEGAFLPGLTCAPWYAIDIVESGDECYTECAFDMDEFNNLSKTGVWYVKQQQTYLIDPNGGDPLDAATVIVDEPYLLNTGPNVCYETCNFHISDHVETGYQYFPSGDNIAITDKIYEWTNADGSGIKFYLTGLEGSMDVLEYDGEMYRFPNLGPEGASVGTLNQCCNPGAIGDSNGVSPSVFTFGSIDSTSGCSCAWSVCDVASGIPFPSLTIMDFPDTGIVQEPDGEISPSPPDGGEIARINAYYGCADITMKEQGFYPSAVKINISSIEDTL